MATTSLPYYFSNRNAKAYPIDYTRPGVVIIFNNENFKETKHKRRRGSDKDVIRLKELFEDQLRFNVKIHRDTSADEMRRLMREYGHLDYTNDSCVFCFVMSHGDRGLIISTDNFKIYLEEFLDSFKENTSLKNKPKVFIIQACRGNNPMSKFNADEMDYSHLDETYTDIDATRLPMYADFLFSYSTTNGFPAFRDPNTGSWFIQILADVICNEPFEEFVHILTEVNKRVAEKEKMMPVFESQLTKKIYLYDINENNSVVGWLSFFFI
jgi:hypothetical protein